MFTDNSLLFNSYTTPVAVTVTGDSAVIDLTGAGVGVAPAMTNGAGNSIGLDVGAGDGAAMPSVTVIIGTTFVGTGTTTMSIAVKAAPQTSATDNSQGTYTTLTTTQAFATPPVGSKLTGGTIINIPIPPLAPGEAMPRYYKLTYTIANGPMTAGALSAGIVMSQPNFNSTFGSEAGLLPKNFAALP
jgi:hypothetical protein